MSPEIGEIILVVKKEETFAGIICGVNSTNNVNVIAFSHDGQLEKVKNIYFSQVQMVEASAPVYVMRKPQHPKVTAALARHAKAETAAAPAATKKVSKKK